MAAGSKEWPKYRSYEKEKRKKDIRFQKSVKQEINVRCNPVTMIKIRQAMTK